MKNANRQLCDGIDTGSPYDPLAKPDAATADEYASVDEMSYE